MEMTKKEINNRRADEIAEKISTPEGRMNLLVAMWYPIDFPLPGETEEQRIERRCCELKEMSRLYYEERGEETINGES